MTPQLTTREKLRCARRDRVKAESLGLVILCLAIEVRVAELEAQHHDEEVTSREH